MDLDRLKSFLAVAELRSFTRAAEQLHVAQSPLSRRIRSLEADLGLSLFERTTRDVRLTPAGEALRESLTWVVGSYDAAVATARGAARGDSGSLSIGFGEILQSRAGAVVSAFVSQYPSVTLNLSTGLKGTNLDRIHTRQVDVGMFGLPHDRETDGLKVVELQHDTLLLAVNANNPLANENDVSTADLAEESFIGSPRAAMLSMQTLLAQLGQVGRFVPRVRLSADSVAMHLVLVAAGLGVSLMPASYADSTHEGAIRFLRVRDFRHELRRVLAYSASNRNPLIPSYVETALRVMKTDVLSVTHR